MKFAINVFFTCVTLCVSAMSNANICVNIPIKDTEAYSFYNSDISITSYDATNIAANIFIPKSEKPANGYPAIILISSWNFNEYEYLHQAQEFATQGYAVLSYATRGFGCSGGMAEVASENDIHDLSAVVDYLFTRDDVDKNNIGVSGVSYGAGIALIGVAKEPRIKTAAAMSGWGSLAESLYGQQTGRIFWGNFLTLTGTISGTLDPQLNEIFTGLLNNENIEEMLVWSEERSPLTYIDLINERQAPVFISHNYGDNLFQINSLMRFFHQLTGPKYFELNQGSHASTEIPGLFDLENDTWENVHSWFDQWLKGDSNKHYPNSQVSILTNIEHDRELYSKLPGFSNNVQTVQYYLKARKNFFSRGTMTTLPDTENQTTNSIFSGFDSGASTGIPALSAIIDGHLNQPVKLPLSFINPLHGLAFISPPVTSTTRLRGIPKINISVSSSSQYLHLVAYLYDVNENGIATLITHGPISRHDVEPGQPLKLNMELVATAYDIQAGHSVALVFDTFDLLYDVPTFLPYELSFHFTEEADTLLKFPILQ